MDSESDERRVAVIIEDDADIRDLLEAVLTQAGFDAIATSNGLDGVRAVREHDPIVTTLDVSMPGMDGFETAKRIRTFSNTYLVMLTARDDEIDTLQGLEAGADDYLTKPFRPRELRARITAMLRRPRSTTMIDTAPDAADNTETTGTATVSAPPVTAVPDMGHTARQAPTDTHATVDTVFDGATAAGATSAVTSSVTSAATSAVTSTAASASPSAGTPARTGVDPTGNDGWFEHNGLRLNAAMRLVTLKAAALDLTRTEFDLLAALLESRRRVRSKADLALLLHGESPVTAYYVNEADKRAVEVHMGNLRRKLGDSSTTPRWLETVRGVGYRLAASDAG